MSGSVPTPLRYKIVKDQDLVTIIKNAQDDRKWEIAAMLWEQGMYVVTFRYAAITGESKVEATDASQKRYKIVEDKDFDKIISDHQNDASWTLVASTWNHGKFYTIFRFHPTPGHIE